MKPKIQPRSHYQTVKLARNDGWPDQIDEVELNLANYDTLGDLKSLIVRSDPALERDEVRRVAIAAFRNQSEIRDGRWVPAAVVRLKNGIAYANPRAPQPQIESRQKAV